CCPTRRRNAAPLRPASMLATSRPRPRTQPSSPRASDCRSRRRPTMPAVSPLVGGRLATMSGHVLTDDEMGVAERVYEVRKVRKMTQAQLAEAVGCVRTTVVNIESGRQGITLAMAFRLARALGIGVCVLVNYNLPLPLF